MVVAVVEVKSLPLAGKLNKFTFTVEMHFNVIVPILRTLR
jgi:hypothetical protein